MLGIQQSAVGRDLRASAAGAALTDEVHQTTAAANQDLVRSLQPATGSASVAPEERAGEPLSHFQRRLWLLQQLEPSSTAFNLATLWIFDSVGDERVVEAIKSVLGQHAILRATFSDVGDEPRVFSNPPDTVRIARTDLRGVDASQQAQTLESERRNATQIPFDLASEAPVRWHVFALEHETRVLIGAHHIAVDWSSFDLLHRELKTAIEGRSDVTPRLQFGQVAVREAARSDSELAKGVDWWASQLEGIPQLCSLPTDRDVTRVIDAAPMTGAVRPFSWDRNFSEELRALAQQHRATVYMVLVAAMAAVLRAHTGNSDIVLGCPMDTRESREFETVIGPFVNLLMLRIGGSSDASYLDLLAGARAAVLDAYDHRDVPFEAIVERLNPPRMFGRSPLFQVAVVLHETGGPQNASISGGGAVQDVTWYVRQVDGRLEGMIEYRADLYGAETIDRLADQLELLLRSAVRAPQAPLRMVSLLSVAEKNKILTEFNETHVAVDTAPITVQFERQVARCPGNVAIAAENGTLSYAALNRRANRLARRLREIGAGAGGLVGIHVDRSTELLVAMLAVLKAGAAYVPLDARFPEQRLRFMAEDSGAQFVLEGSATRLELPPHVRAIELAVGDDGLGNEDASDLPFGPSAADTAYVIYTSGSTGRPNGVAVTHGALSNFMGSMRMRPGLDETDVIAAVTTISFDIAALELFLPLTCGARIELLSADVAADGTRLASALALSGATVLQATPATWRLLIEAGWGGGSEVRAFCGGEGMPRDLADGILDRVGELWNLYGPTETTIWSTVERVQRGEDLITVGRPVANTRIYVLGEQQQLNPVGVPGEIYIAGAGLARGYPGRPELTAERFLPDPFGAAGARMYRTGDAGRWTADGLLVHLGRLDRQVKIRGFRIELPEIEAVLRQHPAVRDAFVETSKAGPDDLRLVAYMVFELEGAVNAGEMRTYLRSRLPDFMVPSMFMALDEAPLTSNGKLDRKALPDPFSTAQIAPSAYEPPRTDMERLLAAIWSDLLKVERVGTESNFFELGGHSLLSLRVAAAVGRQTGRRMDPRNLFFQTLRQVAAGLTPRDERAQQE
jgi:amino acid adenylation domain-containing protein